jgi:hypothetical protein
MPGVLDSYLQDIYSGALQAPESSISRMTQGLGYRERQVGIPEATQDYPTGDQLKVLFDMQAQKQAIEGEPSIGNSILHGIGHVANALSAGEYAIANAAKAMLKQSRGQWTEGVGDSFLKGLQAGFNDDETYKTRVFDLLTEYGWNPETTPAKIGKHAVGFLAGMMVDPLSWMGLGPLAKSFAGVVGKTTMKRVVEELGPGVASKTLKILKGEQFLNTTGQRFRDALAVKHFVSYGDKAKDVFGLEKLQLETTAKIAATKDTMKAIIPLDGIGHAEQLLAKTVTIGDKQIDLVEEGLSFLGKANTKANQEWMLRAGYKQFLDPGGFKIGVPFTQWETHLLPGGGLLTPRMASLSGALVGHAMQSNMPLMTRMSDKVKESELYKKTFGKIPDALNKHFISKGRLSDEEQLAKQSLDGLTKFSSEQTGLAAESLIHTNSTVTPVKLGAKTRYRPKISEDAGVTRATQDELHVLQQIAFNLSNYTPWNDAITKGGQNIKTLLTKVLIDKKDKTFFDYMKKEGNKLIIDQAEVDKLAEILTRTQKYNKILKRYDELGGHVYDEQGGYFARVGGERAEGLEDLARREGNIGGVAHEKEAHLVGKRFEDLQNLNLSIERGGIKVKPEKDFLVAQKARIGATWKQMAIDDWAEQWIPRLGRSVNDGDSYLKAMIDSPLIKQYPELFYAISERSGQFLRGMRTGQTSDASKGLHDALHALTRVGAVGDEPAFNEKIFEILNEFEVGVGSKEMFGKSNVAYVKEMYDKAIAHWVDIHKEGKGLGVQAEKATHIISTLREFRSSFFKDIDDRLYTNVINKELARSAGKNQELLDIERQFDSVLVGLEEKGFGDQIPQLFDAVGITSDASTITRKAVERLEKLATAKPNRAIEDLFGRTNPDEWRTLEKFGNVKIADPIQPGKFVSGSRYRVRKEVFDMLNTVLDPKEILKEKGGALLKSIDFATEPLKRFLTGTLIPGVLRPAFFARNVFDNYIRRFGEFSLAGDSGIHFEKTRRLLSFDIAHGRNLSDKVTIGGTTYTKGELRNYFQQAGFWRYGQERIGSKIKEIGGVLDNVEYLAPRLGLSVKSFLQRQKEKYSRTYANWNKFVNPETVGPGLDNWQVTEAMLSMMDRGMSMVSAGRRVSRSMFDYGNLTQTEKALSRVFFFYNFQRQAIPYALEQLKNRPMWFTASARLNDLAFDTTEEEAAIPKWVRDYPLIGLGREGDRMKLMSFRNMFSVDVLDSLPLTPLEFAQKLNPVLTIPFEYIMGHDLYLDRKIAPTKYLSEEKSGFGMDLIGKFVGARKVTGPDNKEYTAVDGKKWLLLQRTFFSRMFRDMDTVAKYFEGDRDITQTIMNLGLGLKVVEYDLVKQYEFLARDASEMKSAYTTALKRGDTVRANEILELLKGNL